MAMPSTLVSARRNVLRVAAFVLKYRLNQTPADMAGFERSMKEMFSSAARVGTCLPPWSTGR